VSEFDFEPIRGLPERLPDGETLRWQGAPHWGTLAMRAFHVRTVIIYFGILIAVALLLRLLDGATVAQILAMASWLLVLAFVAVGILTLLAWLYARSTVYSITDQRIVIRFGLALQMAVNIPFKSIESAGMLLHKNGYGDIPLSLVRGQTVSYLVMWPNVRPWHFSPPQPMLRALADVESVAQLLASALHEATEEVDHPPAIEVSH
jgi:hypothetical protein